MKNSFISKISFFLTFLIFSFSAFSEELKFEATSIEIIDEDKVVIANDGVKIISSNDLIIDANQMKYDKEKNFLEASGDIIVNNKEKNIKIKSDNIKYDKKIEKIVSSGNVVINFEDSYSLSTKEIIYLKKTGEIYINHTSKIKDTFGNNIELEKLNFNANNNLIKGKMVKLLDIENNFYNFDSAIIDFSENKIIADNVSIDFDKNIFGNPLNDPRLKGNYF